MPNWPRGDVSIDQVWSPTFGGLEGFTYVALAADGLLAVVLGGEGLQGGLNDTTTQAQDKVKGGLLQYWNSTLAATPTILQS